MQIYNKRKILLPKQFGNGVKSYVINLLIAQMISLNRTQKLVKAMIDEVIVEAKMLKFIVKLHFSLEDWEDYAFNKLISAAVMHCNETSLRVDKKINASMYIHRKI